MAIRTSKAKEVKVSPDFTRMKVELQSGKVIVLEQIYQMFKKRMGEEK